MEEQKENKTFFKKRIGVGYMLIGLAVLAIIIALVVGSMSSNLTTKDGTINEKNKHIIDITARRDALKERITKDSLAKEKAKADREAMKKKRTSFLSETGLDKFKFIGNGIQIQTPLNLI